MVAAPRPAIRRSSAGRLTTAAAACAAERAAGWRRSLRHHRPGDVARDSNRHTQWRSHLHMSNDFSHEGWDTRRYMVKALLVDGEDRHLRAAEHAGIVERTDLDEYRSGKACPFPKMWVPHWAQNSRVTGLLRSARRKGLGEPLVYAKFAAGMAMTALGCPPEMYWHSRQWHWPLNIGSPSAR